MSNSWVPKGQVVPTGLLVLLSILALETARCEAMYEPRLWIIVSIVATCLTALSSVATFTVLDLSRTTIRNLLGALAICLFAEPFLAEWITRTWLHQGRPGEMIFLDGMRGLMLACFLLGGYSRCLQLAATLSLFICLGALAIVANGLAFTIIIVYALIGSWWLMGNHWESLKVKLPSKTRLEIPFTVGFSVSSVLVVGVLSLTLLLTAGATLTALPGWFPTSGGDGKLDPFAARGIGDGDAVVAAKDEAESFGAVESELFLASHMPSMYDMFDDSYGEPVKKTEGKERAVSVDLKVKREENHNMATSQQAGREFSTVRLPPKRSHRHLTDQRKNALFFISGRVPLHLRLESFDTFNGRTWTQSAVPQNPPLTMTQLGDQPWLRVVYPVRTEMEKVHLHEDSHAIKVMNLKSPRIPLPVQTSGVHIDLVDKTEFYEWTNDGSLALSQRDTIPPLQVIHVRSQTTHAKEYPESVFQRLAAGAQDPIAVLAKDWAAGANSSAGVIANICERLKTEYVYDADYVIPTDAKHSVETFLFDSRRGNDDLFASAAAELLRSLGFRCRLATGFYAQAADYDSKAGGVVVASDDLHTWVEVALHDHRWITVEPTPGYEVLVPPLTIWQRIQAACYATGRELARHPLLFSLLIITIGCASYFWRQVIDTLSILWWMCEVRCGANRCLSATRRLLERRAWLAGLKRPASMPLARWYRETIALAADSGEQACTNFANMMSLVLYASPQRYSREIHQRQHWVLDTCATVVRTYSLRQLRRLKTSTSTTDQQSHVLHD